MLVYFTSWQRGRVAANSKNPSYPLKPIITPKNPLKTAMKAGVYKQIEEYEKSLKTTMNNWFLSLIFLIWSFQLQWYKNMSILNEINYFNKIHDLLPRGHAATLPQLKLT